MEKKNYTLDCLWVGEVNSENVKEMARVMVWNCCPCTYKDDEVTAVASASPGMDDKPYHMWVIIDGKHYNYNLNSKRVSAKMGKEIFDNILKAVAEYKAEKEQTQEVGKVDTKKIAKAMARCYTSKETTEVGEYQFKYMSGEDYRRIKIFKDGEFIATTAEVIVADTILHPEKLERYCEEKFGWIMLKYWAKNSELEGTDLYEYLVSKYVEEYITLDTLEKHSEEIFR